jgi:hypothetical protein
MDDTGRTMALVNGLRLMEPNQVVIVPKDSFGELFLPIKSNIGDEIDIHGKGRFISFVVVILC